MKKESGRERTANPRSDRKETTTHIQRKISYTCLARVSSPAEYGLQVCVQYHRLLLTLYVAFLYSIMLSWRCHRRDGRIPESPPKTSSYVHGQTA